MDQAASSFYSAIFNMLPLSQATFPEQRWQRWMQPPQAFHPDKRAAKKRGSCLFSICLRGHQVTFLQVQLVRIVTGTHSETNRWQGGLGHPDWLRTNLPGMEIKAVSPEMHSHAEGGECFEVWKKGE